MTTSENDLLISRTGVYGNPVLRGSDDSYLRWHRPERQPGLRKFLLPLMIALGVFGVSSGAARYLFPQKKIVQQQTLKARGDPVRFADGDGPLVTDCATSTKVVMQGFDLTSYFSVDAGATPVQGVPEHASIFNGYTFWFASEENKAQFEEEPLTYIPAWGGFCSWGISNEDWWTRDELGPDADPNKWIITEDGRLHFFRSDLPMSKFMGNVPGNVVKGNGIWEGWWGDREPGALELGGSPLDTNCFCSVDTCEDN